MKKQFALCFIFLLSCFVIKAQQVFLDKVSIDYAKTVAVWPLMKELEPEWFEQSKKYIPKETISYFNFSSEGNKSVYKRTKEADIPRNMWFKPFADENTVFNDYSNGSTITQKPIYEETYLVQDSLLKIKWKITADTRNIAGFECRKAIGILFDTVAVFAFYTNEIMISGGPEGIHGLPGMILGMGIPRLHTTWFATRVSQEVNAKSIAPATKGKKQTRASMVTALNAALTRWESYGQKLILAFVI
ncbi:GLPGLI family protein [Terrimonas alba]|uniref:GLPGLI family protein n=1 Tax=Terrimonas alba TaxID=3349636 RepID=UPI0035F46838